MADPYGNLTPEEYSQQQQINRQQKMAEMLMGQNQQPQGQMVSGRYVAPSFFQNLQPIANMLTGAYLAKQGDTKAQQLAENLRTRGAEEINTFTEKLKTNPQDAYKFAATAYTPELRQTGLKQMLPQRITVKKGEEVFDISPTGEKTSIAKGGEELHKVGNNLVRDNGTVVYEGKGEPLKVGNYLLTPEGKVIFKAPVEHAPHAPQLVETANGFVQFNPNTGAVVPVMVNGKPMIGTKGNLPEGATGQITGIQNVKSALSDLKTNLEKFKPQDMLNPNTRALMSTDYQNMVLQLKEAMKLGVLNGNDYQILTSMITNPNDPKAFLVSKETQMQQITNLNKKLDDMTANVYKSHQRLVPPNLEVVPPNTGWRVKQ